MTEYDKELQSGTEEFEEATEPLEDATKQHPENRRLKDHENDQSGSEPAERSQRDKLPDR